MPMEKWTYEILLLIKKLKWLFTLKNIKFKIRKLWYNIDDN